MLTSGTPFNAEALAGFLLLLFFNYREHRCRMHRAYDAQPLCEMGLKFHKVCSLVQPAPHSARRRTVTTAP